MRVTMIVLAVLACGSAWAASGARERERLLDEQHRRCVEACPKPVIRQGPEEEVWAANAKAEARYDNCVHNCDRMLLRGGRR